LLSAEMRSIIATRLIKDKKYLYSGTVRTFEIAGFKTIALLAIGRTATAGMRRTI